jgi:hypothetical protein
MYTIQCRFVQMDVAASSSWFEGGAGSPVAAAGGRRAGLEMRYSKPSRPWLGRPTASVPPSVSGKNQDRGSSWHRAFSQVNGSTEVSVRRRLCPLLSGGPCPRHAPNKPHRSLSGSSGPRPTSAFGAATSTVDALWPQMCSNDHADTMKRRPPLVAAARCHWNRHPDSSPASAPPGKSTLWMFT